jgi:hypothetical protein
VRRLKEEYIPALLADETARRIIRGYKRKRIDP